MTSAPQKAPVLSLGDKQYAIESLPEEAKKAVAGLQVAESQIRMVKDQLNLLSIGRQTLMGQLQASLEGVEPITAEWDSFWLDRTNSLILSNGKDDSNYAYRVRFWRISRDTPI